MSLHDVAQKSHGTLTEIKKKLEEVGVSAAHGLFKGDVKKTSKNCQSTLDLCAIYRIIVL